MTNLGRVNSPTTRCLAPRTCKSSAKAGRLRPMALDRCGLHAVAHSAAHWLKYPRARIIHTPSMGGRLRFYCPGGHRTGQWRGPRRSRVPPRRTRAAFLPKCGTAGILFNLRILVRAVLCLFGRRRRRRCAAAASGRCAGASLAAATAGIAAAVGQVAPDSASHCRTWASTALQRFWLVWGGGAGAPRQRRGGDGGSRNLRGPRSAAHRPPPSIVYSPQRVARGRYILRPGACCVGGRVTHGLGMGM